MGKPELHKIKLHGEYDLDRRQELAQLFGAIDPQASEVQIDLSEVPYADSSFINELALLRKRLGGARISLCGARPALRRMFKVTGFDSIFEPLG